MAEDLRARQRAAGKMRLQRLDETSLVLSLQIAIDPRRPRQRMGSLRPCRSLQLFKVENRSKRNSVGSSGSVCEELYGQIIRRESHGAIGSPKIDSNYIQAVSRSLHSHYYVA